MNPRDQNDLLKAILSDEDLVALRAHSLAGGLNVVRRRRRIRLVTQGAIACVPLLFACVWWLRPATEARLEQVAAVPRSMAPSSDKPLYSLIPSLPDNATAKAAPISDEQLLALFPDRTVALIGQPGHQTFLVFDGP
jgi:hypothetical protein